MSMHARTARTCVAAVAGAGLTALVAAPASASAQRLDTGWQPLVSYNATQVPAGAQARVRRVTTDPSGDRTIVVLQVRGLVANREYGAHAHKLACGATDPAASGGHFQYVPDPVQPSVDPAYANPDNEIWLDLTTDGDGNATAQAVQRWQFPNAQGLSAHSVVLHDHHTATASGAAGTAGPRYGCLTVAF